MRYDANFALSFVLTALILFVVFVAALLQQSITDAVENDLSLMDGIVLPIAFFVMAVVVRSVRLLFIPLVCIGISVLLSFTAVYILSREMTILSFVSDDIPSARARVCV